METVTQLLQQHADLFTSMYSDGILDDHFIQIHNSLDPEDPGFLKKLADVFYQDSEKRLLDVAIELQKHEVNFRKIDEIIFDFRDSSNCFGTRRLVITSDEIRTCYKAKNFEGCVICPKYLEDEYFLLKRRLEAFLQLEHEILAAGGTVPFIECPGEK